MIARASRWAATSLAALGCFVSLVVGGAPDPLLPVPNGPRRPDPTVIALINATVVPEPGKKLEHATVVIREGLIAEVLVPEGGKPDEKAPEVPGARVIDCTGLFVYAGFVEPYLEVDAPKPDPESKGAHWSEKVTPQRDALDGKGVDEGAADGLRKQGFAAAAIVPKGGIFKGSSALVSLAKPESDVTIARPAVYGRKVYQTVDFERALGRDGAGGDARWGGYPDSLMGSIAVIRQVLSDADWQASGRKTGDFKGAMTAIDALALKGEGASEARVLFKADDDLDVLRAEKIAREFKRPVMILASGTEYQRLEAIKARLNAERDGTPAIPLIVPLNFPEKPKVASVSDVESTDLRTMLTWEQGPSNPARVAKAGFTMALTTARLKDRGAFLERVRSAIRNGLTEDQALAAVTVTPAQLVNAEGTLGRVAPGYRANLIVADGLIFAKKTKLRDVWVDGQRHEINAAPSTLKGEFDLSIEGAAVPAAPEGGKEAGKWTMVIEDGGVTIKLAKPPEAAKPGDAAKPDEKKDEPKKDEAKPADAAAADAKPGDEKKDEAKKDESKKDAEKTAKARDVRIVDRRISFVFDHEPFGAPGVWAVSGLADMDAQGKPTGLSGEAIMPDGTIVRWSAKFTGDVKKPEEKKDGEKKDDAKGDDAKKDDAGEKAKDDGVSGSWSLTVSGNEVPGGSLTINMTIKKEPSGSVSGTLISPMGTEQVSGTHDAATGAMTLAVTGGDGGGEIKGTAKDSQFSGTVAVGPMKLALSGSRSSKGGGAASTDDEEPAAPEALPGYPFGPYAYKEMPKQEHVVITHATVWTSGKDGIIEDGEVEFKDGVIVYVGKSRSGAAAGATVIDAKGKHVTPGIIDCHSHTGISGGVNESGQAITAQVRIGDVTNPDDISWYRQLAGGVTAVNNLHGSANAIGGQNQVNKVRWGSVDPDDMHFAGAIPGIKFALGENPKQANWGGDNKTRYPQTRMGVEAIIRDRFTAAKEYAAAMKDFKSKTFVKAATGPRRDLQLEAIAEILAGERLIHCHSYRQDEILMMGRLAQEFGFKIGTFQHILEGYKVAEVVRDLAGGGSGFSDWWAFKVEVQDAIPQMGPIMHEQGVIVSYNSDSDELARRLNVEAGKAVKYSRLPDGRYSVTPAEAFKFITLNPAKQLRVDNKVGSLEVGKDADVVIWNGYPLSSLVKAERTYIDGRCYFSLERDAELRTWNTTERARLTQKLLGSKPKKETDAKDGAAPKPGEGEQRPRRRRPQDDLMAGAGREAEAAERTPLVARMRDDAWAYRERLYMDLLRRGFDPEISAPGVCGCDR